LEIYVNHAHLMPPNSWREGSVSMLLRYMDECGIAKAVVFPPFAVQMSTNSVMDANLWALKEIAGEDRLIPYGAINPVAHDAHEVLKMLVDKGIKGAKVHPSIDVFDITSPTAMRFYYAAAQVGFTLDFHTAIHGSPLALATPEKFDTIAWEFPDLKLIFEHMGGRAYYEQFLAVLCNHRGNRIFAGVTSVLNKDSRHWYLGPDKVTDMAITAGSTKLIYGIDFPWHSVEVTKEDIRLIKELELDDQAKEAILGGNLRKLYNLE
jgi:predicted TIM-barrel fold metal-dependent hydrolase